MPTRVDDIEPPHRLTLSFFGVCLSLDFWSEHPSEPDYCVFHSSVVCLGALLYRDRNVVREWEPGDFKVHHSPESIMFFPHLGYNSDQPDPYYAMRKNWYLSPVDCVWDDMQNARRLGWTWSPPNLSRGERESNESL